MHRVLDAHGVDRVSACLRDQRGEGHQPQFLGVTDDGKLRYRCGNCGTYGHAGREGDDIEFEDEGAPGLNPANEASSIAGS